MKVQKRQIRKSKLHRNYILTFMIHRSKSTACIQKLSSRQTILSTVHKKSRKASRGERSSLHLSKIHSTKFQRKRNRVRSLTFLHHSNYFKIPCTLKGIFSYLRYNVRLMQEGRMKGQGFVTLPNIAQAQLALSETNGYILKDKPMVVQFAKVPKS